MFTHVLALVGLVLASAFAGPPGLAPQDSEREAVVAFDGLSAEQLRALSVSELLERMPSDPWLKGSGGRTLAAVPMELQLRAENRLLSDADWVAVLATADVIHTRPLWPAGERLWAWVRTPVWLSRTKITARAVEPALGTIAADTNLSWCGNFNESQLDGHRLQLFDRLPADTSHVDLEITIDQSDPQESLFSRTKGERRLWRGEFRLQVAAVATFEEALPAVSDESTTSAIRRSLRANGWRASNDDPTPVLDLSVGGTHESFPELRGVAVSLFVELRRNGVTVAKSRLVASKPAGFFDRSTGLLGESRMRELPPDVPGAVGDLGPWSLRVTSSSDDVLELWEADRWWKGSFEMPLAEALRGKEAK